MKNKILRSICFIYLAVLFCTLECFAQNLNSTQPIIGQLSQNTYPQSSEIEKLFQQNINLGDHIIYTRVPRGLIVSIPSTLFFKEGEDKILESSKPLIIQIAKILKILDKPCIIESNTDYILSDNKKYRNTWELTTVQADNIAQYLIKTGDINSKKIRSIGFGELMPYNSNVSYKNTMNKRIDFVIINYEKENPLN